MAHARTNGRQSSTRAVGRWPGRSTGLRRLAELLALTGLALAIPVLDVTGRSPDFYLFRRPSTAELRLLVLVVAFGPGLGLWVVERVVGLVNRVAERVLHLVLVGLLFAVIVIQLGKRVDLVVGVPLAVVAAVVALALVVATARYERLRQLLAYAAPAPLVAVLAFALTTPAGLLVRPAGASGPEGSAAVPGKLSPIVVLVLDEFPVRTLLDDAGAIDKRLYPNFARLARQSTWFSEATAVIGSTPNALPALFTGRYPREALAPSYIEYPENLFTLLAVTHRVQAYELITQLCPPTVCAGIPAGHATGLRPLVRDIAGVARKIVSPYPAPPNTGEAFAHGIESARRAGAPQRGKLKLDFMFGKEKDGPERVHNFLAGLAPSAKPGLHMLHLMLPHVPYRRLPSGGVYRGPPANFPVQPFDEESVVDDAALAVVGKQRLLLQVAYLDSMLGTMLDRLEETGLWDDALVVVTADHGVGLEPKAARRRLNEAGAPDVTNIPMFVKTPGQRKGQVDRRNIQQVDLVPTVADVLDVELPWTADGRSAFGAPRPNDDRRWTDFANGKPVRFAPSDWTAEQRRGVAAVEARPELGPRGLFAVGPLRALVHRELGELTVGAPLSTRARLGSGISYARVQPESGAVPAMLWGAVDRPPGGQRWLAVSVNGTVAGVAAVVRGTDSAWHFLGVVSDEYFDSGSNDVRLYAPDGDRLREVPWSR